MEIEANLDNIDLQGSLDVNVYTESKINVNTRQLVEVYCEPRKATVVTDEIFIPVTYDEAPLWLKNTINSLIQLGLLEAIDNINGTIFDMNTILNQLEVAKNRYEQSIVSNNTIDAKFNAVYTTLTSSLEGVSAELVALIATKVSPEQASTLVIERINSELTNEASGSLGSQLTSMRNTITNLNSSMTQSYESLESKYNGVIDAQSTAISSMATFVGIDPDSGLATGGGLIADIDRLQKQNDGIIETVSGDYDVILNAEISSTANLVEDVEPYLSWVTADNLTGGMNTRLAHVGDTYIKLVTNPDGTKSYLASYKFIKTDINPSNPDATDSEGFTWAIIVDQVAQDAYEQAVLAYNLAEGKRRIFIDTPFSPIDEGDLWIDNSTVPTVMKYFTGASWEVSDTQLANFISEVYTSEMQSLQNQVDSKLEYWFQINDPKLAWTTPEDRLKHNGDIWYKTDTQASYYYVSTTNTWSALTDKDALDALDLASKAQATADGKISSYSAIESDNTNPPTDFTKLWFKTNDNVLYKYTTHWENVNPSIGDLLYANNNIEDNIPYKYNGTSWVSVRDGKILATASALTALDTSIHDPVTGSLVNAMNEVSQTLNTTIANGDILVESKFAYNSNIVIGGIAYSSGFGLATSVNMPSAGIPAGETEFWVNADKFKVYEPTTGASTIISGGKINADLIEMKTEENGYVFTIDKDGIKIVKDGILRLLIGKIS